MKQVLTVDRPREKLDRLGPAGLGDNELLAVILGAGSRRMGALEVANAVLALGAGLYGLRRASCDDLSQVPGVGYARATRILAAIELGRRTLLRAAAERPQIITPRDAAQLLLPQFTSARVEQFGVLLLDTKHRVIKTKLLSVGTLDASVVHPREVFREAVSAGASALILFHNHPSGDPQPSPDDIALTRRIVAAGDLMGIGVIDHVVLGDTNYFSFRDANAL